MRKMAVACSWLTLSIVYKGIELAGDSGAGCKLLRLPFEGCH